MVSNNPDLFAEIPDLADVRRDFTVPLPVAQHVLWHYGDTNLGLQPGTFVERLMLTLSAADKTNRAKLAEAFPEYVMAFRAVSNHLWGLDRLRDLVREIPAAVDQ